MTNEERIREEIADYLAKWFDKGRDWGKQNIDKPTLFNLESDSTQILSIKGIRIEADNQDLPSVRNAVNKSYNDYMLGQEDMLTPKEGEVWVKCLSNQPKIRSHILTDEEFDRAQEEFRELGSNY